MFQRLGAATFIIITLSGCTSINPWIRFRTPTLADYPTAQAIGTTGSGCVAGAIALAPNGTGYQVMRLARNHFWGHPALIQFLERLGSKIQKTGIRTVLVGDLSQPRGGPSLRMHRSHQNGLDVDIWLARPEFAIHRPLTSLEREELSAGSVLNLNQEDIDSTSFTSETVELLRITASFEETDRIFVHPVIKRELCIREKQTGENWTWLQKIRPWWGHNDHLHVRLLCPLDNALCSRGKVDPLPPGDGCDDTLNWWFSEEAKELEKEQTSDKPIAMPQLPPACDRLLAIPEPQVSGPPTPQ